MEFTLYNRKFKLINYELFSFYKRGKHQLEKWRQIKLYLRKETGYKTFGIKIDGKTKNIQYHRVVYYAHNNEWDFYNNSKENYIDHIDGKDFPINHPKNNNIENLRIVSQQENQFNRRDRGCHFDKSKGKYKAQICLNYKKIHIGMYDTEQEAHQAYLAKKAELHKIRTGEE